MATREDSSSLGHICNDGCERSEEIWREEKLSEGKGDSYVQGRSCGNLEKGFGLVCWWVFWLGCLAISSPNPLRELIAFKKRPPPPPNINENASSRRLLDNGIDHVSVACQSIHLHSDLSPSSFAIRPGHPSCHPPQYPLAPPRDIRVNPPRRTQEEAKPRETADATVGR